jgi:hypothetical protein
MDIDEEAYTAPDHAATAATATVIPSLARNLPHLEAMLQ